MIPITEVRIEISVNGFNPHFQSCFSLRGENEFLHKTMNIGDKSQAYVGFYPVKPGVKELSCMINYLEDKAETIKTSMIVDYFDRLTVTSYLDDGEIDESTEIMVDDTKPLYHGGFSHDIHWRHIQHISSPKGVKHVLGFGEHYLEVYDPYCLEEVNIYRRYDYSGLEFTWVWKKGDIPHGEYELRMRLYEKS